MKDEVAKLINKYNIGQTIYMYVESRDMETPEISPIWDCEVKEINVSRKVVVNGDGIKDVCTLSLKVAFGWNERIYPAERFFTDFEEAKAYGIKKMTELKENRNKNRSKVDNELNSSIKALISQKAEDTQVK
tara:strand:+ start:3566 stop:3961 length:396 start_codon:yes stop_codon:yes gene_type:complete